MSCSLDGTIKVWQPVETPTPGAVLDASPVYVHPPEEPGHPVSLPSPALSASCYARVELGALVCGFDIAQHDAQPITVPSTSTCLPLCGLGV